MQRKGGIIEIIAPLKEAGQLILIHLRSKDPGAVTRLHNETVGHLLWLSHTVVTPELLQSLPLFSRLQEGSDMVQTADRLLDQSLLIKTII